MRKGFERLMWVVIGVFVLGLVLMAASGEKDWGSYVAVVFTICVFLFEWRKEKRKERREINALEPTIADGRGDAPEPGSLPADRPVSFEEATDLFNDLDFDPEKVEFDPDARRIRLAFDRTNAAPPEPGVRWELVIDGAEGFEIEDGAKIGAYCFNEIAFDAASGVVRVTNCLPGRFEIRAAVPSLTVRRIGTPDERPRPSATRPTRRRFLLPLLVLAVLFLLALALDLYRRAAVDRRRAFEEWQAVSVLCHLGQHREAWERLHPELQARKPFAEFAAGFTNDWFQPGAFGAFWDERRAPSIPSRFLRSDGGRQLQFFVWKRRLWKPRWLPEWDDDETDGCMIPEITMKKDGDDWKVADWCTHCR